MACGKKTKKPWSQIHLNPAEILHPREKSLYRMNPRKIFHGENLRGNRLHTSIMTHRNGINHDSRSEQACGSGTPLFLAAFFPVLSW